MTQQHTRPAPAGSMRAQLRVHEVSATLRGTDPDQPVIVGHDGTRVVLVLDGDAASALARILARHGAEHHDTTSDFGFDQATWDRAAVDLLAATAFATSQPVPLVSVPRVDL